MIDINEMVSCVHREIKKREFVYSKLIEEGKMTGKKADSEIAAMKSVYHIVSELREAMRMKDKRCRDDIFESLMIDSRPNQEQGELFE